MVFCKIKLIANNKLQFIFFYYINWSFIMNIKNLFKNVFSYKEPIDTYNFSLPENSYGNEKK